MKKNYKLCVEYDGTDFFGWQRQKDAQTVQGVLESALSRILNQQIQIHGSGRTDAGVHALAQVASFTADTHILPRALQKNLNSLIKVPVVIRDCHVVSLDFHAQYSAVSKTYQYVIYNHPTPCAVFRQYQWHIRQMLDIEAMNLCCEKLIGTHDFKSFENTGSPRKSTVREVFFCRVQKQPFNRIVFEICASGFLKYMVRNITGTLVLAGQHRISPQDFVRILQAKDRTAAGPTAPPHGLFLNCVNYA